MIWTVCIKCKGPRARRVVLDIDAINQTHATRRRETELLYDWHQDTSQGLPCCTGDDLPQENLTSHPWHRCQSLKLRPEQEGGNKFAVWLAPAHTSETVLLYCRQIPQKNMIILNTYFLMQIEVSVCICTRCLNHFALCVTLGGSVALILFMASGWLVGSRRKTRIGLIFLMTIFFWFSADIALNDDCVSTICSGELLSAVICWFGTSNSKPRFMNINSRCLGFEPLEIADETLRHSCYDQTLKELLQASAFWQRRTNYSTLTWDLQLERILLNWRVMKVWELTR